MTTTKRYRATLAYNGAAYLGYQRQKAGLPTVQGVVEAAVSAVLGVETTVLAAGRTDTGVHATGQVIAFDATWKHGETALFRAIESHLPPDVALQDLAEAPQGFHPRFDAQMRAYHYTLIQSAVRLPLEHTTAWVVRRQLNIEAMQTAAAWLPGRRDFAALGTPPQGDNTVRTVHRSEWVVAGDQLVYHIEADAFLYRMVRRTVGLLYDVGRGTLAVAAFREIIEAARLAQGVTVAPPQGLVLARVRYDESITRRVTAIGKEQHAPEDF